MVWSRGSRTYFNAPRPRLVPQSSCVLLEHAYQVVHSDVDAISNHFHLDVILGCGQCLLGYTVDLQHHSFPVTSFVCSLSDLALLCIPDQTLWGAFELSYASSGPQLSARVDPVLARHV